MIGHRPRVDAIMSENRSSYQAVALQVTTTVLGIIVLMVLSNGVLTDGYGRPLHEIKYPSHPYGFGYDIVDHKGNRQHRHEHSDGHRVVGSYGYVDAYGIRRHVDYVADELGFRAKVRTNEPGTDSQQPAFVRMLRHR